MPIKSFFDNYEKRIKCEKFFSLSKQHKKGFLIHKKKRERFNGLIFKRFKCFCQCCFFFFFFPFHIASRQFFFITKCIFYYYEILCEITSNEWTSFIVSSRCYNCHPVSEKGRRRKISLNCQIIFLFFLRVLRLLFELYA